MAFSTLPHAEDDFGGQLLKGKWYIDFVYPFRTSATKPSLQFKPNGSLSIFTGCTFIEATFVRKPKSIKFSNISKILSPCSYAFHADTELRLLAALRDVRFIDERYPSPLPALDVSIARRNYAYVIREPGSIKLKNRSRMKLIALSRDPKWPPSSSASEPF